MTSPRPPAPSSSPTRHPAGRHGPAPSRHRRAAQACHAGWSLVLVSTVCVGVLLAFVFVRIRWETAPPAGAPAIGVGDCVRNPSAGRTERAECAGGRYYARVLAQVDSASQCAPPSAEAFAIPGAAHPVLCLQPRAAVGGCLAAAVGPPEPVTCTDPSAIGRIVARRATAGMCPAGTTRIIPALYGLVSQRVICLVRPR